MSNMYTWEDGNPLPTWNPLAGPCPHECDYGYCKAERQRWEATKTKYTGKIRIHEKAMKGSPGKGTIFVCSMNDLFAKEVPKHMIERILAKTRAYPGNTYLFQTKNPKRMLDFTDQLPMNYILGMTLESDETYGGTKAPNPFERVAWFEMLPRPKMINIEPVMKFNFQTFLTLLLTSNPDFISIGADSKGCDLPEPDPVMLRRLIKALQKDYEVRLKSNLERIIGGT